MTRTENKDLEGFPFRQIVGPAFWRWLAGKPSILSLLGDFGAESALLVPARERCLAGMKAEVSELLDGHQLPHTIASVITLTFEHDEPNATA